MEVQQHAGHTHTLDGFIIKSQYIVNITIFGLLCNVVYLVIKKVVSRTKLYYKHVYKYIIYPYIYNDESILHTGKCCKMLTLYKHYHPQCLTPKTGIQ